MCSLQIDEFITVKLGKHLSLNASFYSLVKDYVRAIWSTS